MNLSSYTENNDIVIPASPVVHSFGFYKLSDILTEFCESNPHLPLVSVGCGLAFIERDVRARVKNDFFLVDPKPGSFYPQCKKQLHRLTVQVGMPATHSYTKELVQSNPEIAKGDGCLLFLNWCAFGNNPYDLEAVSLLKPYAILTIIDVTGSAGSKQFHSFLKSTTDYRKRKEYSLKQAKKEKYTCVHETISIQWLVGLKGDDGRECLNETIKCGQIHDDTNEQNILALDARRLETQGTASTKLEMMALILRGLKYSSKAHA